MFGTRNQQCKFVCITERNETQLSFTQDSFAYKLLTYLLTLPSASEAIGNNQQQAKFVYTKNKKTIIAK